MLSKSLRENLVFVAVSLVAFTAMPALAPAQTTYDPVNFTEPLKLSRGSLTPLSPEGIYLTHEESCEFVVTEFGWVESQCAGLENLVFGSPSDLDTLIVEKPNSEGYVEFDDWEDGAPREAIDEIWESYVEGTKAQSERLGVDIAAKGWKVYPTLDQQRAFMFYAIELDWGGDAITNITATLFDRKGYITFKLVPVSEDLDESQMEGLVRQVLESYRPAPDQAYANYTTGDKVAAAGAVGVLATLMGVKYGKGFFAAALAFVLAFAKKAWFLLIAIPLALVKFFRRKKD